MAEKQIGPAVDLARLQRFKQKADATYVHGGGKGLEEEDGELSLGYLTSEESQDGPILSAYGEGWATQDGTPMPDFPVEINVCRGRNLLDQSYIELSATNARYYRPAGGFAPLILSAGTYTLSASDGSVVDTLSVAEGSTVLQSRNGVSSLTFTIDTQKELWFDGYWRNGDRGSRVLQLELGSTPHPYLPYGYVGLEVRPHAEQSNLNDDGTIKVNTTVSSYVVRVLRNTDYTVSATGANRAAVFGTAEYPQAGMTVNYVYPSRSYNGAFTFNSGEYDYVVVKLGVNTTLSNVSILQSCTPIPLPSKGWVGGLPDGTADSLTIDSVGRYEWVNETDEFKANSSHYAGSITPTLHPEVRHVQTNVSAAKKLGSIVSNMFLAYQGSFYGDASGDEVCGIYESNGSIRFNINASSLSADSVAGIQAWMDTNAPTILYPLATPTTEHGRVKIPKVLEGSTVTIPELENVNVKCFLKGIGEVMDAVDEKTSALSLSDIQVITDSHDGPIYSATARGWAEQVSTTGKNLLNPSIFKSGRLNIYNVNADGSITVTKSDGTAWSNIVAIELSAGTYTISSSASVSGIWITTSDSNYESVIAAPNPYNVFTFTLQAAGGVKIKIDTYGSTYNFITFLQLEQGSTATSYEPYTGGTPSPSPEFPQEIRVARGRNLLDQSLLTTSTSWQYLSVQLTANTVYTVSFSNSAYDVDAARLFAYATGGAADANTQVYSGHPITVTTGSDGKVNLQWKSVDGDAVSEHDTQLELGTTPTPYVPYGHVGLEVQGRNLMQMLPQVRNGITWSIGDDGKLHFSGTAITNWAYYYPHNVSGNTNKLTLPAGTYTIKSTASYSGHSGEQRAVLGVYVNDSLIIPANQKQTTFTLSQTTDVLFWVTLFVATGETINGTLELQLELGTEATDYEPYYHETRAIPLPLKGFAASLPIKADTLTIDSAGRYEWNIYNKIFGTGDTWSLGSTTPNSYGIGYLTLYVPNSIIASNAFNIPLCLMANIGIKTILWAETTEPCFFVNDSLLFFRYRVAGSTTTLEEGMQQMESLGAYALYAASSLESTESGYVNLPLDIPEGSTITIPELEDVGVKCFVPGAKELAEHAANWGKRSRHEDEEIEDAIADLATRVAALES